jgi:hypothetical protein
MVRAALLLALLLAAPAAAKPGDLDRSFGHGGRTAFVAGPGYSGAAAVALDLRGRPLLGGFDSFTVIAQRLTRNGRIERRARTGIPGLYASGGTAIAALPDGGAVVAGMFNASEQPIRIAVLRTDAHGRAVASAILTSPDRTDVSLADLGVDGSGRIYVLGNAADESAYPRTRRSVELYRLRADLSVDRASVLGPGTAKALLVRRDGRAFATGREPSGRPFVLTIDAQGAARLLGHVPLHSRKFFNGAGPTALARGPHGTLLVAGNDTDDGGRDWPWLTRLRPNGRIDRRFARRGRLLPVGTHRRAQVWAMVRDRRGRIVLAGERLRGLEFFPQAAVMRVTPRGRLDRRFGVVVRQLGRRPGTRLIASEAFALAIDSRGRILVAGQSYDDDVAIREDVGLSYFAASRLRG